MAKKENSSVEVKKEKKDRMMVVGDTLEKIDNYRWSIILFVVGFLLATLIFRCIFWPDRIATLKDGTQPVVNYKGGVITADDLYNSMKSQYSINVLVNDIDNRILSEKYPSTEEMEDSVKNTAEYYYTSFEKNYGYTKEQFLENYGFPSETAFLDNLRLDYRRNMYYDEYAASLVTDKEIEKYYEDEVFGDVDSKHILVSISDDGLSDSEAKKLAEEIISKLNKGSSWDDVVSEYKDQIIAEELGYKPFNAALESAYLKEMKNLKVDTYSKTPVLTSYGYHVVYKINQKDKPAMDDVKDDIKDILADEKKEKDSNLYYKSLISMRDENEVEFVDTVFKEAYTKYISEYK